MEPHTFLSYNDPHSHLGVLYLLYTCYSSQIVVQEASLSNGTNDHVQWSSETPKCYRCFTHTVCFSLQSSADMCLLCKKRVYPMEQMLTDKGKFHKQCFKCSHCKRVLKYVRVWCVYVCVCVRMVCVCVCVCVYGVCVCVCMGVGVYVCLCGVGACV